MLINILNLFGPIALLIFTGGLALRLGRVARAALTKRHFNGITENFAGAPARLTATQALKEVLINPFTHFYRRGNPAMGLGYALYHMAIITEVIGYTLSALIVAVRVALGQPLPDVALHLEQSRNYSLANLLALVFGNAEALQAHFLFGNLAPLFVSVTWVAVVFAVAGNLTLLVTLLRKRGAAVVSDLDPAARGLRIGGRLTWDRLTVRLLIFCIIWTELFARLELLPGIVFLHALLGLTLFTLFPFTYLFHMVYGMLSVSFATRRRMARSLA